MENIQVFLSYTGFANATPGHIIMLLVGLLFIFLAIRYEFEPMLLIPIGFGILIGNIPFKERRLQGGRHSEERPETYGARGNEDGEPHSF